METTTLISVREYLNTTYRPDRDYVDGEVRERNLGERPHSRLQRFFVLTFARHESEWGVEVLPEQRVQTSERNYRVPDVCVVKIGDPQDNIVRVPPLVCIEILSPSDSLSAMAERVRDYSGMGVENIWLIDPVGQQAWVATVDGFSTPQNREFSVRDTAIRIPLASVFAALDGPSQPK